MELEEMKDIPVIFEKEKTVSFGEHVSDLIGEDYREWKQGDVVFLSASTGLGKTYWVMNDLYEYARSCNKEVAVLLNRRILKDQVWEDARVHEWERYRDRVGLHIFSYQQLEMDGESSERDRGIIKRCDYVVCDECHYFLADAFFNTRVQKSFDFLMDMYYYSTLIFISATIERVMESIETKIVALFNERFIRWNDDLEDEWMYKKSGKKRSLGAYMEIVERNGGFFKTYEECEARGGGPTVPHKRIYSYHRELKGHINVHYFKVEDDLVPLITDGTYSGKWLVFVADKKKGKELSENIGAKMKKKPVYIDSDLLSEMKYGELKDDPAYKEVSNIRRSGMFGCDVLITTSVLDNGVNIKDPDVKNIVLMTDDEVEFKQMLGRKRFLSEDETIEVFISCGERKAFVTRDREYYNVYWTLCDNPGLSPAEALELAEKEGFRKLSYYDRNEYGFFHSRELTVKTAWIRGLFCNEMAGRMFGNEDAFLEKQLEWLGMCYTEDWKENECISISQDAVAGVAENLRKLYDEWTFFDENGMKKIWDKIFPIASKADPSKYKNAGPVEIGTVNGALKMQSTWSVYQIKSEAARDIGTVYELLRNSKHRYEIDRSITLEQLNICLAEAGVDMNAVVNYLFHGRMEGLNETWMKVYVNKKMKESDHLNDYILKEQNGKITTRKRPQKQEP